MEKTSKLNPQAVLALLAMAFVVAAIWAATALAGGGSPSASNDSTGGSSQPAAGFVQSEEDGTAPAAGDCPEGDSGSSESDSSDSSSTDF